MSPGAAWLPPTERCGWGPPEVGAGVGEVGPPASDVTFL